MNSHISVVKRCALALFYAINLIAFIFRRQLENITTTTNSAVFWAAFTGDEDEGRIIVGLIGVAFVVAAVLAALAIYLGRRGGRGKRVDRSGASEEAVDDSVDATEETAKTEEKVGEKTVES